MINFIICLLLFSCVIAPKDPTEIPQADANQIFTIDDKQVCKLLIAANVHLKIIYNKMSPMQIKEFNEMLDSVSERLNIPRHQVCLFDIFRESFAGDYDQFNQLRDKIDTLLTENNAISRIHCVLQRDTGVSTLYVIDNIDPEFNNFSQSFLQLYLIFSGKHPIIHCLNKAGTQVVNIFSGEPFPDIVQMQYGHYKWYAQTVYTNCFTYNATLNQDKDRKMEMMFKELGKLTLETLGA
jgi:hypothetical protein